jgi:drug/metabolite transporter (DMT)-like permease
MTRLQADALLLLTAAIWGTAFIGQIAGNQSMPPISFVGVRFLISAVALLPFVLYETKRPTAPLAKRDYILLGAIGICLFIGGSLQQVAMVTASATHGGFLTALYVVLVPFTTWILTRERIRPIILIACAISIAGAWLLASKGGQQHAWVIGDALLIAADFAWAFWISLIAVLLKRVNRPFFLSFCQFAITGVLAMTLGLIFEPVTWQGVMNAMPSLLYTGLISGCIAFTLQIFAQNHTPAPEAALIMSLESVFAAIAGAILLGERLTALAAFGCALILAGVMLVEIMPALLRRKS